MYYIRTKKETIKTINKNEADKLFKNDGIIMLKIISITFKNTLK